MKRSLRSNHQGRLLGSLALLLCVLGYWVQPAAAEGSRTIYPNGATGHRASLYSPDTSLLGGTLKARTILKVYAVKDEYINLGSTAVGVNNNANIVVYNPGLVTGPIGQETIPTTPSFSCNSQRTSTNNNNLGKIASRIQELAGPDTINNETTGARGNAVPTGYVPCFYKATQTGIYDVIFYPPDTTSTTTAGTPTGEIEMTSTSNFNVNQGNHISAWDVTVRSSLTSTTDRNGRLFAYYYYMRHGGNSRYANFSVYPVTLDGYRYKINLRGLDPNAFAVYGNNSGFFDSDGVTPLYHDVLGNDDYLTTITGGASAQRPQFPTFVNTPDSTVISTLAIPLAPTAPVVSNFSFSGTLSGNNSLVSGGGNYSYTANVNHSYEIVISRDGANFDPTNTNNRVLRGIKAAGSHTVSWDGKDNGGNPFPVGSYSAKIVISNGEYHFPMIDAENSLGGPTFTLLNPPGGVCGYGNCSIAFYDDRGYKLSNGTTVGTIGAVLPGNGTPSVAYSGYLGFDSNTNQRAFGNGAGNGWGDRKGLDLWTSYPSPALTTPVNIVVPVSLSGTVFEDVNYGGGAGRNYTTANNSAIASGFSSGAIRRPNVRVELYNTAGNFITSTLTDSNGAYTFSNQPANANYTVRVVNSTVTSVRPSSGGTLIPVQTYRTTATGGTATAVTDHVGGENPTLVDAGNGSTTLAALTTGTNTAQSLAAVSAGTTNITGLDFGFNFDTIVNTRDSGQGSLRQFIINSNTLNNANLAQTGTGLILGRETSIFMLSDSAVRPGLRAGLPNQFSGGVATITLATALPAIVGSNAANTAIDGSRQTAVTGNTNLPVPEVTTGPEIVINVSAGPGLEIRAANTIISDLGITGANGVGTTGAGVYFNGTGVSGSRIQNSTIFSNDESGITLQSATRVRVSNNISRNNGVTQRLADGIEMIGAVSNIITDNEILNNPGYGIDLHTTANNNNFISLNLIKNNGSPDNSQDAAIGLRLGNNNTIDFNSISGNLGDGIVVVSGTGNKISQNSTFANGGLGIDLSGGTEGDGVTLNESGDGDTGANGLLNFPILESAKISGGNLILTGFARPGSTIELFVADLDPSSFGEGQQFVATLVEGSPDDTDPDTGNYGSAPVNGIAQGTDNTNRFRFTIPAGAVSTSSVLTATATCFTTDGCTSAPDGSTSEFSGYATVVSASPKMSLVKRITAVNGTPLLGFDGTATDPNDNTDPSEDANWPTPFDTYLRGRIDGGFVKPGDEVEYTIYFLNSENPATNVAVCDPVPANLTFVANGYNSAVPHSVEAGALPSETGIALGLDDTTLPTSPTVYLTNVNDSDRGRYYPPNDSQTPSVCASNTNGAVVVNVVTGTTTLPNATTPGTPANSYGFIRFKVKVK